CETNSVLSADAAEFVPKAFTPPSQMSTGFGPISSVQNRIQLARQDQNVHQTMNIQRNQSHWQQSGSSQNYHHHQYSDAGYRGQSYQQHYNQYSNNQDYGQYDGGSGDYIDKRLDTGPVDLPTCLIQLESAMRTLTLSPGKFDSLVAHLVDTVNPFLDQPNQCEQIFQMIIQQLFCVTGQLRDSAP
ncbi:uncharacterized protein LOC111643898, partial [Copidosoma floridanum]|uniref:uncharacterized protein LOC111643898 n=1 Tax=Copidosoma floridanum TaxID=29053 RepID=UPI000C6FC6D6